MSLVAVGAAGVDRYHRGGPFEYRGHQKRDDRRGKNPRGDKDDTILSVIASRQQESPIKKPMVQHFPRKRPLSSAASEVHDGNELAFGSFSSENVENPVKSPDDGDFFSRSEGAGGGKERGEDLFVIFGGDLAPVRVWRGMLCVWCRPLVLLVGGLLRP